MVAWFLDAVSLVHAGLQLFLHPVAPPSRLAAVVPQVASHHFFTRVVSEIPADDLHIVPRSPLP